MPLPTPEQRADYARRRYAADPERFRSESRERRTANLDAVRERDRSYARTAYASDPDKFKARKRNEYQKDPAKIIARGKKWRAENPEKARAIEARRDKERLADADLLRRYGISREQWLQMKIAQDSKCAICCGEFGIRKHIHVDHCHKTGGVRSLLCTSCNTMLGRAKDNPDVLRRGASYLDEWSAKNTGGI